MIPPISGAIGALGSGEWSVSPVGQLGQIDPNAQLGASGAPGTSSASGTSGSFGSALTSAIDSLEQTQASATTASQQLATGQLSDPTQAVTAVENASLQMDFASQIQSKLIGDATNIFQTSI
jgi:flagellar hook-basal body complex protein FliE